MYTCHEGVCEDVACHLKNENQFGSVGDDTYLYIWDLRSPLSTQPADSIDAHEEEVNCLAFIPFNEWFVATGSTDKAVLLFDLRKLSGALSLDSHKEEVSQVGWNPNNETALASYCLGRRFLVWDLSRCGDKLSEDLDASNEEEYLDLEKLILQRYLRWPHQEECKIYLLIT